MKKFLIPLFFLFGLPCSLICQETVNLEQLARTVLAHSSASADFSVYQGGTVVGSMASLALATGDGMLVSDVESVIDNCRSGKVKMTRNSNFIWYQCCGEAAADMALSGYAKYIPMIKEYADRAWKEQRRTAKDNLMTGNFTRPSQPDIIFADVTSTVVPFYLKAGLLLGNQEYVDYAVYELMTIRDILLDKSTGLFHQSRGLAEVPDVITEDCWSRGNGWISKAFTAMMLYLPKTNRRYKEVMSAARDFYTAVIRYQNPETGIWHQEMTDFDSYPETSGSGYLLSGIGAALQSGILPESCRDSFVRGLKGLLAYVDADGGIGNCCRGCLSPGDGSKEAYRRMPYYFNEPHAAGPVVNALSRALVCGIRELSIDRPLGYANEGGRPVTYCRLVTERKNDFAWENDRAAFRVYSLAASKDANGVDYWVKGTDHSIIDRWYRDNQNGKSYHKDWIDGGDFYNMGRNRGIGGTGVWEDGTLYHSGCFEDCKVIRNDGERIIFELRYKPFITGSGRTLTETKRIEMICGTNFYRATVTFSADDHKEVTVAAGITDMGKAEITKDAGAGKIYAFERIADSRDRPVFYAVVGDPARTTGMVRAGNDELLLMRAESDVPLVFYAGAGWTWHQSLKQPAAARMLKETTYEGLEKTYYPFILTPKAPDTPRINGPKVYGNRPGSDFLYKIPATGSRPMTFSAEGLPAGLKLDSGTGIISGRVKKAGTYKVVLRASNSLGQDTREFRIEIGDRLSLTPPMGWNSWNCWRISVSDEKVRSSVDAIIRLGLDRYGWQYVNIDDGWQYARGGKYSAIQPNRKFPDMKALVDYIHSKGLKAGIYSSPWIMCPGGTIGSSCMNPDGKYWWVEEGKADVYNRFVPGPEDTGTWDSYRYHGKYLFAENDARQWADWGFDFLKYDWHPNDLANLKAMYEALHRTGRSIVYSLSNRAPIALGDAYVKYAQAWRTSSDITDSWKDIYRIGFTLMDRWAAYTGPGHWPDADMLEIGRVAIPGEEGKTRLCGLTPDEQYTHFTLWAILNSPLLIGCDLESMDDFTLSLLTNNEVIDVNQDPMGYPAARISDEDGKIVYHKPLEDGSLVVALFNTSDSGAVMGFSPSELHYMLCGEQTVRDLWAQKDLASIPADGRFEVEVAPHGVKLLKLSYK